MKRYIAIAFLLCAISAGIVAAQTGKPATTGDDAAAQADRALAAAYEKATEPP